MLPHYTINGVTIYFIKDGQSWSAMIRGNLFKVAGSTLLDAQWALIQYRGK